MENTQKKKETKEAKEIDQLTPEQEALMLEVEKEWLARAFDNPTLNEADCREGINWIYSLAELPAPEIVFMPSPMDCQLEANRRNADDGALPDKLKFYAFEWVGWGDYGWVAFYDFFERIGAVTLEEFTKYRKFIQSGIYDMIAFEELAIVSAPPSMVNKDTQGRLHSVSGPAIAWGEHFQLWYISGVHFEHKLWQQVITGALSGKQILELDNMEQRMIALKLKGMENVLDELQAKTINKTDRNELVRVDGVFDTSDGGDEAFFLKYTCPSTGRVYLKHIPPDWVSETQNADELQAKTHHTKLDDYLHMVEQGRES